MSSVGDVMLCELENADHVLDRGLDVYNPFSGNKVGTVQRSTASDIETIISEASRYRVSLSRRDRISILSRTADILKEQAAEIATLISRESGLCLKDTLYEVDRAVDVSTFAAHRCSSTAGEIHSASVGKSGSLRNIYATRVPERGIIAAISPFNHPLNTVAHKVIPAVATNNRVILKPSELTPLSAFRFRDILIEAGLPPEMFHVVVGDASLIGDIFVSHPSIGVFTFTGSVNVGKALSQKVQYKKSLFELGGNDPFIVMEDADVDKAADLIVAGATKNSGQRCTAIKRVLAVQSISDRLAEAVSNKTSRLRVGDPLDPDTDMGTLISEAAARKIADRIEDATRRGARILFGGERNGALLHPVVLDNVPFDCPLVREETFGPVIPIIRCPDNIEDVIAIANSTEFGLSSGVSTKRLDYISRFIAELDVGNVNIDEVPGFRIETTPFGGIKDSGLGQKEGIDEAMKFYTTIKTYSLPIGI
jgi:putative phosphonoacetaldehyde dehydrogenase